MTVEFDIDDYSDAAERAIRQGLVNSLEDVADKIVEHAVQMVPVKTGNLQRSINRSQIHKVRIFGMDHVFVVVGAYAPYAASVEWGTAGRGEPMGERYAPPVGDNPWPLIPPGKLRWGPYPIKPNPPRKALRWEDPVTGEEIFASMVMHPGIEAQPYMRPAIDLLRLQDAEKIFKKQLRKALRDALPPVE